MRKQGLFKCAVAAAGLVLGLGVAPGTALAHDADVVGVTACYDDGSWAVTWHVATNTYPGLDVQILQPAAYPGTPVPSGSMFSRTATYPMTQASAREQVQLRWTDAGGLVETNWAQSSWIDRQSVCHATTTTTTTTTTPPTTTTPTTTPTTDPGPTTTTPTSDPGPTTTAPTTTPSSTPTTDPGPTTTVVGPPTTTPTTSTVAQLPPVVVTTTTTPASSSAGETPRPGSGSTGVRRAAPLPATGSGTDVMIVGAAVLILAGIVLRAKATPRPTG